MLTTEDIQSLMCEMVDHATHVPSVYFLSERMHRRIWLVDKMTQSGCFRDAPRKLRTVQMRRIVARRNAMRRRFERIYEAKRRIEVARLERTLPGVEVRLSERMPG